MSSTSPQFVAFFGATGGCALASLTRTLHYAERTTTTHVNALARTPSKLTNLLHERGVAQPVIDKHLTIVSGDVKDHDAVAKTLLFDGTKDLKVADTIISGIGLAPVFQSSVTEPVTLSDPNICAEAMRSIVTGVSKALEQVPSAPAPVMVAVSTTGISKKRRDVPYAFKLLYHWLLAVPHADKLRMEDVMEDATFGQSAPLKGFVSVRPSLLMDGEAKPKDKIRVGWEWSPRAGPEGRERGVSPKLEGENADHKPHVEVGYTINRENVGLWMFEEIIQCEKANREKWLSKMVTLTE